MNINPNYNYASTAYSPNFKAFVITEAGKTRLERLASGENFKTALKDLDGRSRYNHDGFKIARISILNGLHELLQLQRMAKDSKKFDIIYDACNTGISRKGKDTVYKAPFDVLGTYVAGKVEGEYYPVIFDDLHEAYYAYKLKEKIDPEKAEMYEYNIIADVYRAIEHPFADEFIESNLKTDDYIPEHGDIIESDIRELAKKLLEG